VASKKLLLERTASRDQWLRDGLSRGLLSLIESLRRQEDV